MAGEYSVRPKWVKAAFRAAIRSPYRTMNDEGAGVRLFATAQRADSRAPVVKIASPCAK
jgi:hypothetical protein